MTSRTKCVPAALVAAFLILTGPLAAAFRLPRPEKISLANGMTFYYLRTTDVPLVSFQLYIGGAGSAAEPAELEGGANLAADLLLKGTATMTADEVAEALEFMGADLFTSAAEEYVRVSLESLAEHFPRALEIAADCLMSPAFKDEEFRKERDRRIDQLKAIKDEPGQAVRYYFQKAYFGDHPLGRLSSGTEASLGRMSAQALKAFYEARYRPARTVGAVVGDIEKRALVALLERTLGKWRNPAGPTPAASLPPPPRPRGPRLVLVDKPDATQAYFVLGAPGYPMGDPITAAAQLMNTLFGGRFTSWLNTELRIERGLTYGASSAFRSWRSGGLFTATSYTKNDKIGEMLDITFGLLRKGSAQGFEAAEVESARNYIEGQFPPTLEANGSKAGTYVRLAFYGLGFDYYDTYLAKVAGLSPEEAKAAAAKLLPSSDFVLVVVGKSSEIRPLLQKFGTWQEKKVTDPGF
jgi:predicted Zn-dependent peptidase